MSLQRNSDFHLIISSRAKKDLDKLPKKDAHRVAQKINLLLGSPFLGKELSGELKGSYSLRIWPYRVIYEVNKKLRRIDVNHIGHRQGVYK